jgi:hypothetical protein
MKPLLHCISLAAAVTLLAACQASGSSSGKPTQDPISTTATPSPVTAAPTQASEPTASAAPTWDLVLMSDSVLLQPTSQIVSRLEQELGVTLKVHDWINPDIAKYGDNGGERSADLLARLRTDEALRRDLREAEVILFDVPLGILNDTCARPDLPSSEFESCWAEIPATYRADADAIFTELVALRDPSDAIIRVTDVWQFLWPTLHSLDVYDTVRPAWQAMNQAVADAAARHGIPLIRAYDAFTGPDGERDPVAAGDVLADEFHLTPQGSERLVDLIVALGFEPLR